MIDSDRSPAEPLPEDVIRRQGDHVYVSTACHHGLHPRCRDTCKFCGTSCRCHCHDGAIVAGGVNALELCTFDMTKEMGP